MRQCRKLLLNLKKKNGKSRFKESMNILDEIENELERCMKEDGKMVESIYLGKDEIDKFMDELLKINGITEEEFESEKEDLKDCDIILDCYEGHKVTVIPSPKKNELRFTYKNNLLN